MAPASGMSTTLPRNFAPMGLDGISEPKTPDQGLAEVPLPPPPHHSTSRVRRPRVHLMNMHHFTSRNNALPAALFASDIPLPSIEVPSATATGRPGREPGRTDRSPTEKRRAASDRRAPPPRTPPAQTTSAGAHNEHVDWDRQRSSSSCSTRSDTSRSSGRSFASRPTSFGGSATSPECDGPDPFLPRAFHLTPATPTTRSHRVTLDPEPAAARFRWTTEMDNHLWNVYQMYLADPSITPFKAAPGVTPPLGVCNRVARVARRTWPKATRVPHQIVHRHSFRDVRDDAYAVRERTPTCADRGDGLSDPPSPVAPVAPVAPRTHFPDKNLTRRRFKELCRQKFSITPHYQRLRESRSPSPFTEPFAYHPSRRRIARAASHQSSTTYATRDLGISLVASGATGALAQLGTDDSPPPRPEEWFNTPVAPAVEATSSPPTGLGIESAHLAPARSVPRLASPFSYNTWDGPSRPQRDPLPDVNRYGTVAAPGSRLLSPLRFDPFSHPHKRRAPHQLEDDLPHPTTRQELVFTGDGDISQRRIRLRNRGATLGAASDARDRLHRLFSPPPPLLDQSDTAAAATTTTTTSIAAAAAAAAAAPPPSAAATATGAGAAPRSASLAAPEPDDRHKRLGSPFELEANKRSNRNKSPRHIPSLSDPFIAAATPFASTATSQSIGERLASFSVLQNHPPNNHGFF